MANTIGTQKQLFGDESESVLSRLSAYARERGLSNRELAEELGVPENTLSNWRFFTQGKGARNPSEPYVRRISGFLENKEKPELYAQIKEARRRTEKIKYLLLLLEDELRWFRDGDPKAREEFRQELSASDIGYISSLLTMLTQEDKFQRWLALTTTRFESFGKR